MSDHDPGQAPKISPGQNAAPDQASKPAAPKPHTIGGISCGMGGSAMPMMLAILVGVALGALLFGGGGSIASATQFGGWTFLLFLLPCLLMFGAMMMMGNKSDRNGKP